MGPEVRVDILERGLDALRQIEADRRALLPPPEREDPILLREIREFSSLADRLHLSLGIEGFDQAAIYSRDMLLSMDFDEADVELLEALASDTGAGTPYRAGAPSVEQREALRTLTTLLRRYLAGEFMPPDSFFGIPAPEV